VEIVTERCRRLLLAFADGANQCLGRSNGDCSVPRRITDGGLTGAPRPVTARKPPRKSAKLARQVGLRCKKNSCADMIQAVAGLRAPLGTDSGPPILPGHSRQGGRRAPVPQASRQAPAGGAACKQEMAAAKDISTQFMPGCGTRTPTAAEEPRAQAEATSKPCSSRSTPPSRSSWATTFPAKIFVELETPPHREQIRAR